MENTPLRTVSIRANLNNDQHKIDEIRIKKYIEDGKFSAFRPICDRQAHIHNSCRSELMRFSRECSKNPCDVLEDDPSSL